MRAKLFGAAALALAFALLFAAGATSQPEPGGKDKGEAERVSVPASAYSFAHRSTCVLNCADPSVHATGGACRDRLVGWLTIDLLWV